MTFVIVLSIYTCCMVLFAITAVLGVWFPYTWIGRKSTVFMNNFMGKKFVDECNEMLVQAMRSHERVVVISVNSIYKVEWWKDTVEYWRYSVKSWCGHLGYDHREYLKQLDGVEKRNNFQPPADRKV